MRSSNPINKEIERLKSELEDLTDTGVDLKNKATDTLIEQTEARPLTTLAAMLGIGFIAGWLCRRPPSDRSWKR